MKKKKKSNTIIQKDRYKVSGSDMVFNCTICGRETKEWRWCKPCQDKEGIL